MSKLLASAVTIATLAFGTAAFAASGSSGLDPSSSTSNNQVGSAPASGGSMKNPGGNETPKNADVPVAPGVAGASQNPRTPAGRDPRQNSTLGTGATAPRGDSR